MKPRILSCVTAMTLLAALALPIRLAAQHQNAQQRAHPRYRLVDIGTFGGGQSAVFEFFRTLTKGGTLVGVAETSTPDPNYPNFSPLIGFGNPDPFIQHAFQWRNGVLTDLGALINSSQSVAVNGKGVTAGVSENGLIDPLNGLLAVHAVVWQDDQIIDLGTLGGGYESTANDINNRGQVVGASLNQIPDPFGFGGVQLRAFIWQNGAMQDLGTLGTGNDAVASLTNERGQVTGWSYTNSTANPVTLIPTQHPYLWENGRMLDLGSLGGTAGAPNALNNRGEVAGLSNLAGDTTAHPFRWSEAEGMKDLGTLGGTFGDAFWINEAGEVVGLASLPGDEVWHAFLWKDGVTTDLGTLKGDPLSVALGVNSKGQVVGNSGTPSAIRGFLWENGAMFDLNTLVSPGSKLNLFFPSIINDRGEIAGQGQLPNGDIHAFLLIPCEGDHAGEGGCEDAPEATNATIQDSPLPANQSSTNMPPSSLTPIEIEARMRGRFGP